MQPEPEAGSHAPFPRRGEQFQKGRPLAAATLAAFLEMHVKEIVWLERNRHHRQNGASPHKISRRDDIPNLLLANERGSPEQ